MLFFHIVYSNENEVAAAENLLQIANKVVRKDVLLHMIHLILIHDLGTPEAKSLSEVF